GVAPGNVAPCEVSNSVRTFAASAPAPCASLCRSNAPSFTVGSVAADVCASGATGVTTTNNLVAPFTNDIDLVSQTGSITLANAVNAGSATGRPNAGTSLTQTVGGAGAVTAASLAV